MVQQVEEEVPSDRVECLFDIKLEEQSRGFFAVKAWGQVANVHKVIMDTSSFDEGALSLGNKVIHVGSQTVGHDFGDDLRDGMNQTNGAKVRAGCRPILLWNEGNVCGVEQMKVGCMHAREMVNCVHNVALDDFPTVLEEGPGEAVRTRRFVTRHIKDRLLDLLFREGSPKVR